MRVTNQWGIVVLGWDCMKKEVPASPCLQSMSKKHLQWPTNEDQYLTVIKTIVCSRITHMTFFHFILSQKPFGDLSSSVLPVSLPVYSFVDTWPCSMQTCLSTHRDLSQVYTLTIHPPMNLKLPANLCIDLPANNPLPVGKPWPF